MEEEARGRRWVVIEGDGEAGEGDGEGRGRGGGDSSPPYMVIERRTLRFSIFLVLFVCCLCVCPFHWLDALKSGGFAYMIRF